MRRLTVLAFGLAFFAMAGAQARGTPQASTQVNRPAERAKAEEAKAAPKAGATAAKALPSGFDLEKYFSEMEEDVAVYDPASPWIYEGKGQVSGKDSHLRRTGFEQDGGDWRKRVEQMVKIRQFLDLNQFHKTEVELGDMRIVTVYREIRRVEGSMTSRLHGRITWVYLKQPDGRWFLWHDHTSEIPEDYSYER
jgi:ketosteroid isomerase-like protein